jgi:hypothetical protein
MDRWMDGRNNYSCTQVVLHVVLFCVQFTTIQYELVGIVSCRDDQTTKRQSSSMLPTHTKYTGKWPTCTHPQQNMHMEITVMYGSITADVANVATTSKGVHVELSCYAIRVRHTQRTSTGIQDSSVSDMQGVQTCIHTYIHTYIHQPTTILSLAVPQARKSPHGL